LRPPPACRLPAVSIRAATYEHLQAGREGFWTNGTRTTPGSADMSPPGRLWFFDRVHPDGTTGHRVFAELLYHLYNQTLAELAREPVSEEERVRATRQQPPMVADNLQSMDDRCLIGPNFAQAVVLKDGWSYVNEAKESPRPKWGFVSNQPGSRLHIRTSTMASSESGKAAEVMVELAHLKSYEGMGVANVTCEGGCQCSPSELNGHHQMRNSQLFLHSFAVSQSPACIISITVLEQTQGAAGAHKVKVTGIIVSEQAGSGRLIHNAAAVDYVSDIAARDIEKGGKFNVLNHAR
jgi:hypothetical protein